MMEYAWGLGAVTDVFSISSIIDGTFSSKYAVGRKMRIISTRATSRGVGCFLRGAADVPTDGSGFSAYTRSRRKTKASRRSYRIP